jgi:hypothetical protein
VRRGGDPLPLIHHPGPPPLHCPPPPRPPPLRRHAWTAAVVQGVTAGRRVEGVCGGRGSWGRLGTHSLTHNEGPGRPQCGVRREEREREREIVEERKSEGQALWGRPRALGRPHAPAQRGLTTLFIFAVSVFPRAHCLRASSTHPSIPCPTPSCPWPASPPAPTWVSFFSWGFERDRFFSRFRRAANAVEATASPLPDGGTRPPSPPPLPHARPGHPASIQWVGWVAWRQRGPAFDVCRGFTEKPPTPASAGAPTALPRQCACRRSATLCQPPATRAYAMRAGLDMTPGVGGRSVGRPRTLLAVNAPPLLSQIPLAVLASHLPSSIHPTTKNTKNTTQAPTTPPPWPPPPPPPPRTALP